MLIDMFKSIENRKDHVMRGSNPYTAWRKRLQFHKGHSIPSVLCKKAKQAEHIHAKQSMMVSIYDEPMMDMQNIERLLVYMNPNDPSVKKMLEITTRSMRLMQGYFTEEELKDANIK